MYAPAPAPDGAAAGVADLTAYVWAAGAPASTPVGLTTPNDQVTPDASSFYAGQYVPPGRQPGQVPQACPS